MLILSNQEIADLLEMSECMQALDDAYRALVDNRALNTPRVDGLIPHKSRPDAVYSFKQMGGVIAGGVQALRINSDVIHWPETADGGRRRVKIPAAQGRWVGLVYLFDPDTGMPLAMMPDGVVQHFRVGAANGLAARYLAPTDVETMALLGTGWQAETQLMAFETAVHPRVVHVFSPTPGHAEQFCREMSAKVSVRLVPTERVDAALSGATVVAAATNSMVPVLKPEWVRPGMHFSTIKAQEVGEAFVALSGLERFLHTKRQAKAEVISAGSVMAFEKERGWWANPDVREWPDLSDLVSGRTEGRRSPNATTLFVNNVGMGLQFAAVGGLVLQKARQRGIGRELPDDWFIESVHP